MLPLQHRGQSSKDVDGSGKVPGPLLLAVVDMFHAPMQHAIDASLVTFIELLCSVGATRTAVTPLCVQVFPGMSIAPASPLRATRWCLKARFIARYMPLMGTERPTRCPPLNPRPMPSPGITGILWATQSLSGLAATLGSARCSIRYGTCRIQSCPR